MLVPYSLEEAAPADPPSYLNPEPKSGPKIVLSAVYTKYSSQAVEALQWAVEKGFTIDLDIATNLRAGEGAWADLEELLTKAIPTAPKGTIILCRFIAVRLIDSCLHHRSFAIANILPPPDDLSLPIVKLLTHPNYRDYQSQTAALSLYPSVVIKFLPPSWGADAPSDAAQTSETIDVKEWKRRIKMYSKCFELL